MASLSSILPTPKVIDNVDIKSGPVPPENKSTPTIPRYGQRRGWAPKALSDFGDGGAYPEIHVPQFPLNMGLKQSTKSNSALTLQVTSEGNIDYGALVRTGHSSDRIVHSEYKDMIPALERQDLHSLEAPKPSEEEAIQTIERTRRALDQTVTQKTKASQPNRYAYKTNEPTYIRYTPNNVAGAQIKQRIIRIVDQPVDPLEPPKFRHKKIPADPASPPPPVLHSPPHKVTAQQQQDWVIPPCISNWKNPKGYTIPLDKRLASDGRGLQDVQINDKFASLSEALFTAERLAREEIKKRQSYQLKLQEKEKAQKEEHLRTLAMEARKTRLNNLEEPSQDRDHQEQSDDSFEEREQLRREKQKEREKETKLSKMGKDKKIRLMEKHEGRDVSEKIALGLAKPTQSKESMFDSRLFNQSEGLNSGFRDEEAYNLYEKPLFQGSSSTNIYRPTRGKNNDDELEELVEQDRFGSVLGKSKFKGADNSNDQRAEGPVKFEKAQIKNDSEEEDPFGLDEFLNEAKKGKEAFKSDKR